MVMYGDIHSGAFHSFRRRRHKLSVNVVATSEVSVSLTLNKNTEILFGAQKGTLNQEWAKRVQV